MTDFDSTMIVATDAACGNQVRAFAAIVRDAGMVIILPGGVGVVIPTGDHTPGTIGVVMDCTNAMCPEFGWRFAATDLDVMTDNGLVIDEESGDLVHQFTVNEAL